MVDLTHDQRISWLRLLRTDKIGPATFRSLVNEFGSAEAALAELPTLARKSGADVGSRIPSRTQAEDEIARTEAIGGRIVAMGEALYPNRLRDIPAAPPLLTVIGGSSELMQRPAIAVVGSRNASIVGEKMAERLSRGLGDADVVVVSGLARGIDAAAHRASIDSGTIAVIAGGADCIYPEEHTSLVERIVAAGGALVTEMPLGWEARARDFPRRNRIVSGISSGVVVIEAAAKSGTLHTARYALEQGRDVFAVPGSPLDPRAAGTNRLIKDGAILVCDVHDILDELAPRLISGAPIGRAEEPAEGDGVVSCGDEERATVLSALGPTPVAVDDIILHTGLKSSVVSVILLELELAGRIERHGNQLVSLVV